MDLLFKEVMCGMNDSLESNVRPINLASPVLGICVPFFIDIVEDLNVVSVVGKN